MAHRTRQVAGNVESVDHVSASFTGCPIMVVTLTNGESYKTQVNNGVSWSAGNFRPHSLHLPVSPVVLTVTDHDRIVGMRRPEGFVDNRFPKSRTRKA